MTLPLVVIAITQFLMKFLETPLADFAGKWKLVIVSALSVVLAVATGLSTGLTLVTSLLSGAGLAAIQVFIHQIYVQFFNQKA